jgi:hypothetical protein
MREQLTRGQRTADAEKQQRHHGRGGRYEKRYHGVTGIPELNCSPPWHLILSIGAG